MRKKILLGVLILLAVAAVVVGFRIIATGNKWLCQNGQWVKHGYPATGKPNQPCAKTQVIEPDIIIFSPKQNQLIASPLTVEGLAKGHWFFEAVFPMKLLDDKGKELAAGQVRATSDWTTDNLVPFKGEIAFEAGSASKGLLVLRNDNPSGLPEKEIRIQVSVVFSRQ